MYNIRHGTDERSIANTSFGFHKASYDKTASHLPANEIRLKYREWGIERGEGERKRERERERESKLYWVRPVSYTHLR